MITYATVGQLSAWLAAAGMQSPTTAAGYLRSASFVIAEAGNRNPYTDVPDETSVQPLADATCAQVQSWLTLGITPAALGLDVPVVKKSSILTGDVEQDTTGRAAALACAAKDLAPEARAILLQAGLLWLDLPLGDPAPYLPDWGLAGARYPWGSGADCLGWPFL